MPDPHQPPSASPESGSTLPRARKNFPGDSSQLLAAGTILLTGAYLLYHISQFDHQAGMLVEDVLRSSRSSDIPAVGPILYGVGSLVAFLSLVCLVRSCHHLLRRLRDTSSLKSRPPKSVECFIEEAAAACISLHVARESYDLLKPHYPNQMCIDLSDDLRSDLRLSVEAIGALNGLLRTRCGRRQEKSAGNQDSPSGLPVPDFVTVFDLLQATEASPPCGEDLSLSRDPRGEGISGTPSRQRRLSDSSQRSALYASTVSAMDDGSLCVPDPSGLNRRYSDYVGPRRRATDNRSDAEYKGPYQRATDRASGRTASRTSERPPPSSPVRKTQPAASFTELDLPDSVLVSRPSKQSSEPIR